MISKWQAGILVVIYGCSLALSCDNYTKWKEVKRLKQARIALSGSPLKPMSLVPAAGEQTVREAFRSPVPQVLYVLRPDCEYCLENVGNWREAIRHLNLNFPQVRQLAISTSLEQSLGSFAEELDVPLFKAASPEEVVENRFVFTPQTIVVDEHGAVIKNFPGVLEDNDLQQLFTVIDRHD